MDTRVDASDCVLLVIDMQEKLLPAMWAEGVPRLLKNVVNLVHGAAALGVPILVTEQYKKGLGATVPDVMSALLAVNAAAPIEKTCFSALLHPDVAARLEETGRRRVVVTGIEAHVCVQLTARDLVQEGYVTAVPHDACLSRQPSDHATTLELMRQAGVAVTTTESVLFEWMKDATHPAFRELSRRIR